MSWTAFFTNFGFHIAWLLYHKQRKRTEVRNDADLKTFTNADSINIQCHSYVHKDIYTILPLATCAFASFPENLIHICSLIPITLWVESFECSPRIYEISMSCVASSFWRNRQKKNVSQAELKNDCVAPTKNDLL